MDWTDEGIVLSSRPHGEGAAVVSLLTQEHGRHAGLVRGGASRRLRPTFEAGTRVAVAWRARLEEQLGQFQCEATDSVSSRLLDDPLRLSVLISLCALTDAALPEREPHPTLFASTLDILRVLPESPDFAAQYVRWELGLLTELGFGLDLASCAATGQNDELAYVSPKSGRAVSLSAGEPYRNRLLVLPPFLIDAEGPPPSAEGILDGLRLTGFFLERFVFAPHRKGLPEARTRLVDRMGR